MTPLSQECFVRVAQLESPRRALLDCDGLSSIPSPIVPKFQRAALPKKNSLNRESLANRSLASESADRSVTSSSIRFTSHFISTRSDPSALRIAGGEAQQVHAAIAAQTDAINYRQNFDFSALP